jgi:hypothetical protein
MGEKKRAGGTASFLGGLTIYPPDFEVVSVSHCYVTSHSKTQLLKIVICYFPQCCV